VVLLLLFCFISDLLCNRIFSTLCIISVVSDFIYKAGQKFVCEGGGILSLLAKLMGVHLYTQVPT
jgi:hypothetical protein